MSTYRGGGPAYYSTIVVDPRHEDTVWSTNTSFEWTRDGGRTWTQIGIEDSTLGGACFWIRLPETSEVSGQVRTPAPASP